MCITVQVSFMLSLSIGLFRNFGRTVVCVMCMRVCACVCMYVCVSVCFAIACHRNPLSYCRKHPCVSACACECMLVRVCVCIIVCMERVMGCSPIHFDIISDRKRAFSRTFGKRDRPSYRDEWTDPLIEMRGRI